MKKFFLLILPFVVLPAFAQNNIDSTQTTDIVKDSIPEIDDFDSNFQFDFGDWDLFDVSDRKYIHKSSPTIEIQYGNSNSIYENKFFKSSLSKNASISANIGFTTTKFFKKSDLILDYDFNYLTIANYTNDLLSKDSKTNGINTRLWRANLSNADGYGWSFNENINFILYHSSGIGWTTIDASNLPNDTVSNAAIGVFGKQLRFGKQFAGGAKLFITKYVAINAEYEKSLIYPRHMFWKYVVDGIVEGSAQGLTGWFAKKVGKEAPAVLPIVYFLMKNAVSYGFYELYKDKMNWPMNSAAPFVNENFKIGLSFAL